MPLDPMACHSRGCAKKQRMARHNSVAFVLRDMAREAGHRAHTEQLAVELPPGDLQGPRVTRVADVRVSGCRGEPPVFLDVVISSTRQCTHATWSSREVGVVVRINEQAKIRQWGEARAPTPAERGRFIPASFETQGRSGDRVCAYMKSLAQDYTKNQDLTYAASAGLVQAAFLRRWRTRLSCALQRGNARVILACLGSSDFEGEGCRGGLSPIDLLLGE